MVQKLTDRYRDLVAVCLERKVASVKEAHIGLRHVTLECLCASRQEERIVLAPRRQKRRLMLAEIGLERGVERDIALVVAEQIELNLIRAAACQVEIVERKSVGRNQGRVGDAVCVLPDRRFRGEERT